MWRRRAGQRRGFIEIGFIAIRVDTRVDKPEECDREKCPKMMDICPEGGHCYGQFRFIFLSLPNLMLAVTGDCGDDGCLCNIKIACQEKNDKESENQVSFDAKDSKQ